MPLRRTVFVPPCDSQLSHSQRDGDISCSLVSLAAPGRDQTPAPKLMKRGNKRPAKERTAGLVLTVKLPKNGNKSTGKKVKATTPPCVLEPAVYSAMKTASQKEESQSSGPGSNSVGEKDVYFFSQGKQPKSEKEKVKMAVLRNISRMLAENNLIRQRLVSLSQVNRSNT